MQEGGFKWWIDRVKASFKLYDILRIDHFRGFAGYYTVPAGDTTARNGWWESAPGIQLFEIINNAFPKAKIIAEDLGFITEDVRELLDATGFPGMKILQFAFFDDESEYLPRCYTTSNCVVYSGSHDADCTRTWHLNLTGPARERFVKECPRNTKQSRTYDVIELALTSKANLAVVPIQDYLDLTNEQGRMNVPSVADGNWNYRMSARYNTPAFVKKVKDLTVRTGRAK
jgi:4-alpha-glucanotransferase